MKRTTTTMIALVAAAAIALSALPAPVMGTHDTVPGVGKHLFKFNVIGRSNGYDGNGAESNGRSLFISLESQNKGKSNGQDFVCESDPSFEPEPADQEPFTGLLANKERIYFTPSADGKFEMVDRDATDDNRAEVMIPEDVGSMHVAVRMLGKPGGCADFDGIAEEVTVDGTRYWWTGTIHANRKSGQPEKISVTDIFYVTADFDGDGDSETLSVFDPLFSSYFWEVTNQGLRNMQVIFYSAA